MVPSLLHITEANQQTKCVCVCVCVCDLSQDGWYLNNRVDCVVDSPDSPVDGALDGPWNCQGKENILYLMDSETVSLQIWSDQ